MTRRQWIGVAGVLFGAAMLVGIVVAGTTPDSTGSGAVERYQEYWDDSGSQDRASTSAIVLTYACVLLVAFSAGLSHLLRRGDDGPLPSLVLGAGTGAAALFGVGSALVSAPGVAAAETSHRADGNLALLTESVGYYALTLAVMLSGAMALSASLSSRRTRLLPAWTAVATGLLVVATVGSIFTAWIGFMLLPLWSVVVGVCLLVRGEEPRASDVAPRESVAAG